MTTSYSGAIFAAFPDFPEIEAASMAWRVIDIEDEVWHVQAAAERRPDGTRWHLTLSFRCYQGDRKSNAFWATYPLESGSKTSLFALADRIRDDELREVLAQHNP